MSPSPSPSPRSPFPPGTPVEVACDEEGFRGAWYEATVLSTPSPRQLEVLYDSLRDDLHPSLPLREVVLRRHVRPRPPPKISPPPPLPSFKEGQWVDAFHNDGWWEGVVVKVVPVVQEGEEKEEENGVRYRVWFPCSGEEIGFAEGELREHRKWVKGAWILLPKDNEPFTLHQIRQSQKRISFRRTGYHLPLRIPLQRTAIELPKLDELILNDPKRRSCKRKRSARRWFHESVNNEEPTFSGEAPSLHCKEELQKKTQDSEDQKKPNFEQLSTPENNLVDISKMPSCELTPTSAIGQVDNSVTIALAKSSEVIDITRHEQRFSLRPSRRRKILACRRANHSIKDPQKNVGAYQYDKPIKRGRGRPRKVQPFDVVDDVADESKEQDCAKGSSLSASSSRFNQTVSSVQDEFLSVAEGNMSVQIEDSVHVLTFEDVHMGEGKSGDPENGNDIVVSEIVVMERSSNASITELKDTAIADGIVGDVRHKLGEPSLASLESSATQLGVMVETKVNGLFDRGPNMDGIVESIDEHTCSELVKDAQVDIADPISLPFIKTPAFWEVIESKGIFSTMAQRPHFRPLEGHSEDLREGIAIGIMVNFANLVQSITKLKIYDPRATFEKKMDSLTDYEEHGFNVAPLRECLEKLLETKVVQEASLEKSTLESEIVEHGEEISRLEEDISALTKEHEVLEKSLALLKERLEARRSLHEKTKNERVELQRKMENLKEASLLAERYFNNALASFRGSEIE